MNNERLERVFAAQRMVDWEVGAQAFVRDFLRAKKQGESDARRKLVLEAERYGEEMHQEAP